MTDAVVLASIAKFAIVVQSSEVAAAAIEFVVVTAPSAPPTKSDLLSDEK